MTESIKSNVTVERCARCYPTVQSTFPSVTIYVSKRSPHRLTTDTRYSTISRCGVYTSSAVQQKATSARIWHWPRAKPLSTHATRSNSQTRKHTGSTYHVKPQRYQSNTCIYANSY